MGFFFFKLLVVYCAGFFVRRVGVFGAALITAGVFLTGAGLAGVFLTGACLDGAGLAGIFLIGAAAFAGLSECDAHSSAVSLCKPTHNPVELRPHPHLAGSGGTTTVLTVGISTL
jgi:hypothetical protein